MISRTSTSAVYVLMATVIVLAMSVLHCGDVSTSEQGGSAQEPQYYFAVTTVDVNDAESDFSNILGIPQATALQYTLVWTQPQAYSNGDPFTAADVKTYRVYAGVAADRFLATYETGTATTLVLSTLTPTLP